MMRTLWRLAGVLLLASVLPVGAAESPRNPAMTPAAGGVDSGAATEASSVDTVSTGPDLPSSELPGRLQLHRPNYVLPLTWSDGSEASEDVELKFQISVLHQIGQFPLFFGYTQTAYLRWLDEADSRPFREINFNPELWYRVRPGRLPGERFDWLGIDVGYEHESNGEDLPESRSWDRVYVRPWLEHGRWRGAVKLWYRIPEEGKASPSDPSGDDNPRILDFYGHHEAKLGYTFEDGDWAEITTRFAFSDGHGAVRLRYATPTPSRSSYFFFELFSGYGESLETFSDKRTRVGIGFALLQ